MTTLVLNNTIKMRTPESYTYAQAVEAASAYFEGDELAATTWLNKYAMRGENGIFLECTPAEMHQRLAREFARIENATMKNARRSLQAFPNTAARESRWMKKRCSACSTVSAM
jgi:hypothetical protein